jgi:hypothetical protein
MLVAEAEELADAAAVECVTVHVRKRRWQRLGLLLQDGDGQWPRIVGTRFGEARFLVGDAIYMINGRETRGAVSTARRLVWKRFLSITLLRPAGHALVHGPSVAFLVLLPGNTESHGPPVPESAP